MTAVPRTLPVPGRSRIAAGRVLFACASTTALLIAVSCGDAASHLPGLDRAGDPSPGAGSSPSCVHPGPGCPCDEEESRIVCGEVESQVGDQTVCGLGYAVCTGGRYDACIINNTISLVPSIPIEPGVGPGYEPTSLGDLTPCQNNPCDPTCKHFPDTPVGLSNGDAGVLATDAGLTLPGSGTSIPDPTCTGGVTGTCPHSVCAAGMRLSNGCDDPAPPAAAFGCVKSVCAAMPSCCTTAWSGACAALVPSLCKVDCGNLGGTCVVCYKDAIDHDGDGFSFAAGDCADCDPNINPGAYDFPGNGVDEDCNGKADDEPVSCDTGLDMASSAPNDHVKALDLCRTTTASATGPAKTWGVISSKLVQADGTQAPHALSYGILGKFGPSNLPQKGAAMVVLSSGTARAQGDPGWVNPNGQSGSFNQNKSCAYPPGFPKNKAGCPNGSGNTANDSTGLLLGVRVPTNAKSFSYRFNFFSSEYPEWVCSAYNDGFVALLKTGYVPSNPASNSGNISFDAAGNPVSVNVGFFTVTSGPKLTGTGMDGNCAGKICGGATDWLETSAPVVPGETITLQFALWDTGDHLWDSFVLLDDFTWSLKPAAITTDKPAVPSAPTYSDGYFIRDYDGSKLCPLGTNLTWGLWSWSALTPSDSSVSFTIQTAASAAELLSAPADALLFSNPPGPSALAGKPAVAKSGSPSTSAGSAVVDATLAAQNRARHHPYLRVISHLTPSTDKLSPPVLSAWDLQVDCQPDE
ncbi:MAG: choice-of-anchor L domain-containing protein [Byssovorax sp.]